MTSVEALRVWRALRRALVAANIFFGLALVAALLGRVFVAAAIVAIAWALAVAVVARLITQLERRP